MDQDEMKINGMILKALSTKMPFIEAAKMLGIQRTAASRYVRLAYGGKKSMSNVERGRLGGAARAKALSPERRSEISQKAALARWGK